MAFLFPALVVGCSGPWHSLAERNKATACPGPAPPCCRTQARLSRTWSSEHPASGSRGKNWAEGTSRSLPRWELRLKRPVRGQTPCSPAGVGAVQPCGICPETAALTSTAAR